MVKKKDLESVLKANLAQAQATKTSFERQLQRPEIASKTRDSFIKIIQNQDLAIAEAQKRLQELQAFKAREEQLRQQEEARKARALAEINARLPEGALTTTPPRSVSSAVSGINKQINQLQQNLRGQIDPARRFELQKQINDLQIQSAAVFAREFLRFQDAFESRRQAAIRTSQQQAVSAGIKQAEARALGEVTGTVGKDDTVLVGSKAAEAEKLRAQGISVTPTTKGGVAFGVQLEENLNISDKPLDIDLVKGNIVTGGKDFNINIAERLGFSDVKAPTPTPEPVEEAPVIPEEQIAKRDFELDISSGQLKERITTKAQVEAAKQQTSGFFIPTPELLAQGIALQLPQQEKTEKTVIRQEGIEDRVDQPPAPTLDQQLEQLTVNTGKLGLQRSREAEEIFAGLFGERRLGGESLRGGISVALQGLAKIPTFTKGVILGAQGVGLGLAEEGLATFAFGVNLERQGGQVFERLLTGGKITTTPITLGGTGRFRTILNIPTGIEGGRATPVPQIKIPETAPSTAITEITTPRNIAGSVGGGIFETGQGFREFFETGDSSKLTKGLGSFQAAGAGIGTTFGNIAAGIQEQGIARSAGQFAFLFLPTSPKGFRQLVPIAVGRIPITTGALKPVIKTAQKGGIQFSAFGKSVGLGGKTLSKEVLEQEVLGGSLTIGLGFGGTRTLAIGGRSAVKGILNESSRAPITSKISKALEPQTKPKRSFFLGSPTRKIENLGLENLNTIDRGLELATLRGFERSILTSEKSFKELVALQKIRPDDPELFKTLEGIAKLVKKSPTARQLKKLADPEIRSPLGSLRAGEEAKVFFSLLPTLPKSKGGFGQNLQVLAERVTSDLDVDFGGLFRGERKALSKAQEGERKLLEAQRLTGNIKLTKAEAKELGLSFGTELPRGAIRSGTKVFTGFKVGETIQVPKIPLARDEFLHGTTRKDAEKILAEGINIDASKRGGAFFTAKDLNLVTGFAARRAAQTGDEPVLVKLSLKDVLGFRELDKFTQKKIGSNNFITFQENVINVAREKGFKAVTKPYKDLDAFAKRYEVIVFDPKAKKRGGKIIPLTTQDRLVGKDKFLEILTDKDAIGNLARTSPPLSKGKRAFDIKERKPVTIRSEFFDRNPLGIRKKAKVLSLQDQTLNKIASASAIQSAFTEGAEVIGRKEAITLARRGVGIAEGRIGTPTFRLKDIADLTGSGQTLDTLAFLFKERSEKRGRLLGKRDLTRAEKLTALKENLIKLTPEVDLEAFALKNKLPKGQKSLFREGEEAAEEAARGFNRTKPKGAGVASSKRQDETLRKLIDTQIDTRVRSSPISKAIKDFDLTSPVSLASKNSRQFISGLASNVEAPSPFSPPKSKPDSFVNKTIDNLTSFSKSPFDNSMSKQLNSITKISSPSSLPSFAKSSIPFKPSPSSVTSPISKPSVNLRSPPSFPSISRPSRPSPTSPFRTSPPSPASPPSKSPPRASVPRGSGASASLGSFRILPPPRVVTPPRLRLVLGGIKDVRRRRRLPSFKESLTFIADPPDPQRAGVLLPKGVSQLVSGKSDVFRTIDKNLAKARQQAGAFVPLGESNRRGAGIKPKAKRRRKTKKRRR